MLREGSPPPMREPDILQPSGLSFLTQAGKRRNKHCFDTKNESPVTAQKKKKLKRNAKCERKEEKEGKREEEGKYVTHKDFS